MSYDDPRVFRKLHNVFGYVLKIAKMTPLVPGTS